MAALTVLTINVGSSNLKACLFTGNGSRKDFKFSYLENGEPQSLQAILLRLKRLIYSSKIDVIGHRLVHGGDITDPARIIDKSERNRLEGITHLSPLHMPKSLQAIDLCAEAFGMLQVACFDTAFHSTLPELAYRLPIPAFLNIRRYGFHGINYAYIAKQLPQLLHHIAKEYVIVAHLGNGASLCMLHNLKSVDTTMGFTPAGGVPMATRSGDIDPGIMLKLAKHMPYDALCEMTYKQMGLIALSNGISADIATLEKHTSQDAKFAIQYFARQIRAEIGSLATKFGQVDALVFTGGIGEHSSLIRTLVCHELSLLGFTLDPVKNNTHAKQLQTPTSKPILIVPADEESEIAALSTNLLAK